MTFGIIGIIVLLIALIIIKNIISFGLKLVCFIILVLVLASSVWICIAKPDMHKPFSISTIEYLLNFNKDGSVTTTKQVTTQKFIKDTKN